MDEGWNNPLPNNHVAPGNALRPDYFQAIQGQNLRQIGASTSRNSSIGAAASGESPIQNQCFTNWEPVRLNQDWTIANFTKALDLAIPGQCMRSWNFRDDGMPDIHWQLCLYPGGKREENVGHVSLFLKMSTTQTQREFTVRAEYRFYFMDDAGNPRFSNVNTGDFKVKPSKGSHSWGLRNIPRQKVLNCIRSDNSLQIKCIIEVAPDFSKLQTHMRHDQRIGVAKLTKEYVDRFHQMFLSGEGADCVIECGGQEFPVHKFVLMAQSDVFRAMFSHKETMESVESRIRITDSNSTAVQQMLTYMYSGGLPDNFVDEHAPGLIEISEKYQLESLKIICQDKLISRLSHHNVCSMMVLADVHNADLLMASCIPLVKSHIRPLMESAEWAEIKTTNPKLINTVLEKVVTYENSQQQIQPPQKRLRLQQEIFFQRAG